MITLLDGATATNADFRYATATITFVAKANMVDGETLSVYDRVTDTTTVFEFDVAGDGVSGTNVQVDVSGDTTAEDIEATFISAFNSESLGITASSGGTGIATLTYDTATEVANTSNVDHTVADGSFAATNFSGAADTRSIIGNGKSGSGLGGNSRAQVSVYSTAGSGTMTVTVRLWGFSIEAGRWLPLGTNSDNTLKGVLNEGNAIAETLADEILHMEVVENLQGVTGLAAEITAIGGTSTAITCLAKGIGGDNNRR